MDGSALIDACGPATAAALGEAPALESLDLWALPSPEALAKILEAPALRRLILHGAIGDDVPIAELDRLALVLLALPSDHPLHTLALGNSSHEAALRARFRSNF